MISLRHEFPNAFYKLLHQSPGEDQTTEFNLEKKHFPYFLSDRSLSISLGKIYLKAKEKNSADINSPATNIASLRLIINDRRITDNWESFDNIDRMITNMKWADVPLSGNPIRQWTINAGTNGLDAEKLDDVLILLNYTAQNSLN